jgi:hypothetical protein
MVEGRPGYPLQVIDRQGGFGIPEAGAAGLAVTWPQGGQHFGQRAAAELGLGARIGHGALRQHGIGSSSYRSQIGGPPLPGVSLSIRSCYRRDVVVVWLFAGAAKKVRVYARPGTAGASSPDRPAVPPSGNKMGLRRYRARSAARKFLVVAMSAIAWFALLCFVVPREKGHRAAGWWGG